MLDIDPIKPGYFYKDNTEKTKLNWFCYEYAYCFYSKLREKPGLKKYRACHMQENITAFSVHFSKAMKQSIHDKLSGRTSRVIFDEDYVHAFYPKSPPRQTKLLLAAAAEAWDEHLSVCEVCPTRCISERYEYCIMFDNMEKEGFPF